MKISKFFLFLVASVLLLNVIFFYVVLDNGGFRYDTVLEEFVNQPRYNLTFLTLAGIGIGFMGRFFYWKGKHYKFLDKYDLHYLNESQLSITKFYIFIFSIVCLIAFDLYLITHWNYGMFFLLTPSLAATVLLSVYLYRSGPPKKK
tara:strand:- start:61 stop:498 length:438 start_codon:yes stop_codon:yes gene_type:complete